MALMLFFLESISLIWFDKKFYGTYYTPTIVLAVPMLMISFLSVFFATNIGFFPIYLPVFYLWGVGLFFFWMGGIIISMFINPTGNEKFPTDKYLEAIKKNKKYILLFGILLAVYVDVYLFINLLKLGFSFNDDWESTIGTGTFAHICLFFKLISIFSFICISKKNRLFANIGYIYIFISALTLSILYTVKSGFLILLLSAILARMYIYHIKFKIKYFIYLLILAIVVFFLSYSLIFGYWAPIDFIINHTIFYFTSSIASFSQYLYCDHTMGLDFQFLFMPFVNLYNKIVELPMNEVISDLWTQIGSDSYSNVKTFFGTIFIYGGYFGGIFTSLIWGIVVYFSFIMSIKGHWIFSANACLLISALFFGWFDLYFNTFAYYEYFFYTIILYIFESCIEAKKK